MKKRGRRTPPDATTEWSRRNFIQSVLAVSAATGVSSALPAGAHQRTGDGRDLVRGREEGNRELKVLTVEQGIVLTVALNRLVPASNGMPGAGELDGVSYIDGVLSDAPHLRQPILRVLGMLPDCARATTLPGEEFDAFLAQAEAAEPESFDILLQVAYTAYYSDSAVLTQLGWTQPGTAAFETFDARLLDNVVARGKILRDV